MKAACKVCGATQMTFFSYDEEVKIAKCLCTVCRKTSEYQVPEEVSPDELKIEEYDEDDIGGIG
ncbi:MAG: hypothetical protein HY590_03465 [Candidatus Omnitrophica bacterium]|nr:hypothetical protein [Candidatus Omnitrophota bacterium]